MQETFTIIIIITAADGMVAEVHDRMPLILPEEIYDRWLDIDTPAAELQRLLRPFPATELIAYPVSTIVNNPVNDTSECIQPVQETKSRK